MAPIDPRARPAGAVDAVRVPAETRGTGARRWHGPRAGWRSAASFPLSGETIPHDETHTASERETHGNHGPGPCRGHHEKRTRPTLRRGRESRMAAMFHENHMCLVSRTLAARRNKKSNTRSTREAGRVRDPRVHPSSACDRARSHSIVPRVSALPPVATRARALRRRVGQDRLPSVQFHRSVRACIRALSTSCAFSCHEASCVMDRIPRRRDKNSDMCFRSRTRTKQRASTHTWSAQHVVPRDVSCQCDAASMPPSRVVAHPVVRRAGGPAPVSP